MKTTRGFLSVAALAVLMLASVARPALGYLNPIGTGAHAHDPSVLVNAGTYYLFTSFTGAAALPGNVPLQRSTNGLVSWQYLGDALPNLPAWVDPADAEVHGPTTLTRPSLGRYLLYFSARHRNDGTALSGKRCIGVVAASGPTMLLGGGSSLIPTSQPLVCRTDADVFDPSVYTAANPSGDPYAWLLWVEHRSGQPDVIMHQLLQSDGANFQAGVPPLPLLTADTGTASWEQGLLASPALVRDPGTGIVYLFYSANNAAYSPDTPTVTIYIGQHEPQPPHYGANWATCTPTIYGVFLPCGRSERGPWLRSQNGAFRPGDADFFRDPSGALWMIYDASTRTPVYLGNRYDAPTLRLDKVCIGSEADPRTNAPTTDSQGSTRVSNCALDVHLLAESWPDADQLFHQDPRWRGADGAWSVDLGGDRTLWTFGDTYIDPEGQTRSSSFFIRNSIAIQQGADPTTAQMTFHWKTLQNGNPTAFLAPPNPNPSNVLYWGGAGAVVGKKLVLFQQGNVPNGAGSVDFIHSKAVIIPNFEDDASLWQQNWYDVPRDPGGFLWGAHYAFTVGSYLYVYVVRDNDATGDERGTAALLRYPNPEAKAGNFATPRWWTGSTWSATGPVAVLWHDSTQYSVHDLGNGEHIAIMGALYFGPGTFATATAPTGPFSAFAPFFNPPESSWGGPGVLTYIWHAHPQFTGAPVVVTYSTHGNNLANDERSYYPKFVRFTPP